MRIFLACLAAICTTAVAVGEEPEIIIERPASRLIIPPIRFDEFSDEPEIIIERPRSEEFAERLDLGGMEDIIDVGEWDNDCRINPDDGELLKCRLTW